MNSTKFLSALTASLFMFAAIAGCDTAPQMDYSSVGLVDAHGVVMLDGRPLINAVITFDAPDGTFAYGMTDANGQYELHFDSDMMGVAPGPKTVRISTTRKILGLNAEDGEVSEEAVEEGEAMGANPGTELVPTKYNEESELTVEVTSDRTEYNFDLQTV